MGNNLNAPLEGRFVLLREDWFKDQVMAADGRERVFLASGGFGCSPHTMGNAVYGEFVVDGEECRVEGYNLDERFATEDEVQAALVERVRRGGNITKDLAAAWLAMPS